MAYGWLAALLAGHLVTNQGLVGARSALATPKLRTATERLIYFLGTKYSCLIKDDTYSVAGDTLYMAVQHKMSGSLVRRDGTAAGGVVPTRYASTPQAAGRFIECFAAHIRNPNTRRAYLHAVYEFADWCAAQRFHELVDIESLHVAAYIEQLAARLAKPSVKQHLAAIRTLFDWLVVGQVVAINLVSDDSPKDLRRGKPGADWESHLSGDRD